HLERDPDDKHLAGWIAPHPQPRLPFLFQWTCRLSDFPNLREPTISSSSAIFQRINGAFSNPPNQMPGIPGCQDLGRNCVNQSSGSALAAVQMEEGPPRRPPVLSPGVGTNLVSCLFGNHHMNAFGKFFVNDWYFAVPLLLMSLTAVTLVIWRILLNHNAKTNMSQFLPAFQQRLENEGIDGALRYCR